MLKLKIDTTMISRKLNNPLKENLERLIANRQVVSTQTIDISNREIASLTVPQDATNAVVNLEFTSSKAIGVGNMGAKFTLNGNNPQLTGYLISEDTGMPMTEYMPVILDTVEKMEGFKVIANDLGIRHKAVIKVSYFE